MANLFRIRVKYNSKELKHLETDETKTLKEVLEMWPFFKTAFTHPDLQYIEWQVGLSDDGKYSKVRVERTELET